MKVKVNSIEVNKQVAAQDTFNRKIGIGTSIVNAQYALNVDEKNIIYLALANASQFKETDVNVWYEVSLSDFTSATLSRQDHARVELRNAVKSLYNKSLKMRDNNGILIEHRWIKSYRDIDAKNTIAIMFNEALLPHLMQLREYASIAAIHLVGVKNKYTYRVLELISQGRSRGRHAGSVEVELKQFITMIEAPDTYKEFKYLNKYVLQPVIKELCVLRIATLVVEQLKCKRVVYGLVFRYEFDG